MNNVIKILSNGFWLFFSVNSGNYGSVAYRINRQIPSDIQARHSLYGVGFLPKVPNVAPL